MGLLLALLWCPFLSGVERPRHSGTVLLRILSALEAALITSVFKTSDVTGNITKTRLSETHIHTRGKSLFGPWHSPYITSQQNIWGRARRRASTVIPDISNGPRLVVENLWLLKGCMMDKKRSMVNPRIDLLSLITVCLVSRLANLLLSNVSIPTYHIFPSITWLCEIFWETHIPPLVWNHIHEHSCYLNSPADRSVECKTKQR